MIKSFDYFVYNTFTHKSKKPDYIHWVTSYHNHLLRTLTQTQSQSYQPPVTVGYLQVANDSLYPSSRYRATMELSLHPHDIRVRLVDMRVSWQTTTPIVKDVFLTEIVMRDVKNWFFFDPLLQLIENLWFAISLCCWGSDIRSHHSSHENRTQFFFWVRLSWEEIFFLTGWPVGRSQSKSGTVCGV